MEYVVIGNGLVGYHVADQLARAGPRVSVVSAHPPFPFACAAVQVPWEAPARIAALVKGHRVLWCVGTPRPGDPVSIPARRERWGRVLEGGFLDQADRVVYLSTAGLWTHPVSRWDHPIDTARMSDYTRAHMGCEALGAVRLGDRFRVVRASLAYGPRQRPSAGYLVPVAIRAALRGGPPVRLRAPAATRDLIHVYDAALILIGALMEDGPPLRYAVSGQARSLMAICEILGAPWEDAGPSSEISTGFPQPEGQRIAPEVGLVVTKAAYERHPEWLDR